MGSWSSLDRTWVCGAQGPGSNPGEPVYPFYNFDNILSNKNLKGTDYNNVYGILPGKIRKDIYFKKYLNDEILKEFERYLINRGIYANYKHHICRVRKYLPDLMKNGDKILELNFSYRTLSGIVTAIKYFQEFLFERYNIVLPIDIRYLRERIKVRKQERINLFEYFDRDIINEALEILHKSISYGLKTRIYLLVLFFTGLRACEVNYFLNNLKKLRRIKIGNVLLFELNYNRRTKKAYLTILPLKLFKKLSGININYNFSNAFRQKINKKGIKTYIFRKSFVAIASNTIQPHEIDLLQGRIGSILIKHYVRHLKEIAEKYEKAFKEYEYLIDELI